MDSRPSLEETWRFANSTAAASRFRSLERVQSHRGSGFRADSVMRVERGLPVWHRSRVLLLSSGTAATPVSGEHPEHRAVKKLAQRYTAV